MSTETSSSSRPGSGPQTLRGVFCPTLTPVKADLSPDIERWIAHCRQLLDDGCHGLCPFGTTSEANSFGAGERMEMLERLVEAGVSASRLVPGTGTCSIPETVHLTEHAVQLGCGGVLVLPPFYYKGVSDEGLFRHFAEVIERVGNERLRIYLYHIPPVAQVGFSLDLIERLIETYPSTVVGIKDSSGDWNNLHAMLTRFPGFGIFTGSEKFQLQTLREGGVGSINAVSNVIASLQRNLYDNWQAPQAEELQEQIKATRLAFGDLPVIPVLKRIVSLRRNDPAWQKLRPPLVELSDTDVAGVFERLEALGVLPTETA